MSQKSGTPKMSSERIVKDIRRATRKQYSAEEKIRIVLDGLRGEHSIAELCRREGIAETHKRKLIADGDLQVDGKGAALALPRSNSEPSTDRLTTYFAARAFRLLPIGGWPAPNDRFQDIVQDPNSTAEQSQRQHSI
jgi:transposase